MPRAAAPDRRPLRAPHRRGPSSASARRRPGCPGRSRRPSRASGRPPTRSSSSGTATPASRHGRLGRAGPGAVAGRAAGLPRARPGPGAGARRRGRGASGAQPAVVEAGCSTGDWTARFISPLRSAAGHARAVLRGDDRPARRASCAPGSTPPRTASTPPSSTAAGSATRCSPPAGPATSTGCATRPTTSPTCSQPGENRLEVLLGNGWYRGRLGFQGRRALYGDRLALLAQLEVTTADGIVHVLATDGPWTARDSGVLADDLYDGQRTDLRADRRADATGRRARRRPRPAGRAGRPAGAGRPRCSRRVGSAPRPSGETLVDFGQNLVGWVRLRVRGGARRRRGRGPARRGARGRRARRPPAAHREGHRHLRRWPARTRSCWSRR